MNKTEDTIAMLEQFIKHLEAGHEVLLCTVSKSVDVDSLSIDSAEFSSLVDIHVEYKKGTK